MEKQEQNNDHLYWEEMRNVKEKTVAELHEAMVRSKENYWDDETVDPNEFGLDAYNL